MTTVLIVVHLMVVLTMIGLVLLQRSEGGALGIGGGSGGFMSGRGAGNVLTRTTAILAAVFFLTSVGLSVLARIESQPSDIFDRLPVGSAPQDVPAAGVPAPIGTPTSAEDLLQSLGGPQAPPAADDEPAIPAPAADGSAAPAVEGAAAPMPDAPTPATVPTAPAASTTEAPVPAATTPVAPAPTAPTAPAPTAPAPSSGGAVQ